MRLESLAAGTLTIPFRQAFRHASAERAATQTVWVTARASGGITGHGEGTPREYVTAENLQTVAAFFSAHRARWLALPGFPQVRAWTVEHQAEIDRSPATWAAVELALLDAIGRDEGRSVEALLGLPELTGEYQYSAVLGDAPAAQFEQQVERCRQIGFRDFKIKLSGRRDRDADKLATLQRAGIPPERIRADANNLWRNPTDAAAYLQALDFRFAAIEEPLTAGDFSGLRRLSDLTGLTVILDESMVRVQQLDELGGGPGQWRVNLRVSKMGGLIRSLELLRTARDRGIGIIVGSHVGETSVLTRAGLAVAQAAGDLLRAQEGAFGTHLLAEDVVARPLMFGAGGRLDVLAAGLVPNCGNGLAVRPPAQYLGELK